jgi:SHAQKYF class myb-like DNA-binding protein
MFKVFNSSSSSSTSSSSDVPITNNMHIMKLPLHKHMFITHTLPSSSLSSLHNKKQHRTHLSIYEHNGRWSKEEQTRFIEAIVLYGVDWKQIQKHIHTRSSTQARSHAQKFLMKLKHSDIIHKRNINLNYSWAKSIQILKNEFTQSELETLFNSVSIKHNNNKYKTLKRKHSHHMNIEQSETTTTDEHNEHEDEWLRKDNNEYIKMFIENFNMKKMSFDGNDDNLYRVIPM